jgi:plastocyanin
MSRTSLIATCLLALVALAPTLLLSPDAPAAAPAAALAPVTMEIKGHSYLPDPLTIPAGTPVKFHNGTAESHSATSDTGSAFAFNTGILNPGDTSAPIVFPANAGTVHYHCLVHGLSMKGTIIVKP